MTDISRYPTDALRTELQRRERPNPPTPQPLVEPQWDGLIATIRDGIASAEHDGYIDKNLTQYIFESALEAVYGEAIWDWWKAQDQPS